MADRNASVWTETLDDVFSTIAADCKVTPTADVTLFILAATFWVCAAAC
jgi:hypothetical protein